MKNILLRSAVGACGVLLVLGLLAPSAHAQIPSTEIVSGTSVPSCPVPPPGFNILNASVAQLHTYGLPLPPQGSATDRANWAKDFQHLTSRFCGSGTPVSEPDHPLNQGATPFSQHYSSSHWSGYYASASGFTRARGKWWVPTYCCSPSNSTAAQWIGIGGVNGSNCSGGNSCLFQAGTETDPVQGYRFWWEAFPNPPMYQGPAVSPGNEVYVLIDYNRTCSGQSYAFMYNYATGKYWGITCQNFAPDQSTADWIVERARVNCGQYTGNSELAQTTPVNWHSAFADSTSVGGNTDQNIGYYNNTQVTMVDYANTLEETSSLGTGSDGGSTFTNTYLNHGSCDN